MEKALNPFHFVVIALAGWMNQRQQDVIEYLREENRVLREQLGGRRLRFNDDQRRRLAVGAKGFGRKLLMEIATLVTPATLLAQTCSRSSSRKRSQAIQSSPRQAFLSSDARSDPRRSDFPCLRGPWALGRRGCRSLFRSGC